MGDNYGNQGLGGLSQDGNRPSLITTNLKGIGDTDITGTLFTKIFPREQVGGYMGIGNCTIEVLCSSENDNFRNHIHIVVPLIANVNP